MKLDQKADAIPVRLSGDDTVPGKWDPLSVIGFGRMQARIVFDGSNHT
jgi:hypothetical protein